MAPSIMKLLKINKEFTASEKMLQDLIKSGDLRKLQTGDILLQENQLIRNIPIILKGSVKVYQTDDDLKEMLLYYLQEGDICIMSFLGGLYNENSKVKAVANEESEVLLIPVQKLGHLTQKYPEWDNYIFRIYHERFLELMEVVNAVAFKKMDERLLDFLTQRARITESHILSLTHEEIANELGTARVVISRLLKEMERKNLVTLGRNQVILIQK
jgi:CRP/FNR family transcriptional regulator, anaerobic regulatory protein